jgi:hypothetical protein
MLIFIMVTANIGQVAVDATTVANAADAAVLLLGSQLATKAQMISTALQEECHDPIECCETTGFLDTILAFVFAVVVTIVTCIYAGCSGANAAWGVFAGTLGGMVGGMVGAAIQGTSIAQGAITGAAIGAAVGSIASGIAEGIVAGPEAGGDLLVVLEGEGIHSLGAGYYLIPAAVNTNLVALGALGLSSAIYNASASNQVVGDMLKQLSQDLVKLGEYDQLREGTVFAALYRAVDDPTKNADEQDIDADYDKAELVPRFAWWWHRRIKKLEWIKSQVIPAVQEFLKTMRKFRDSMAMAFAGGTPMPLECAEPPCSPSWGEPECTPGATGALERKDYKWSLVVEGGRIRRIIKGDNIKDGPIVALLRGLGNAGIKVKRDDTCNPQTDPTCLFWRPGPTAGELTTWLAKPCKHSELVSSTNCPPALKSYDGIDSMADGIRRMVFYMDTISPPGFEDWAAVQSGNIWCSPGGLVALYNKFVADNLGKASSSWETWRRRFYNKKNLSDPQTYYFKLGEWIDFLKALRPRLLKARNDLKICDKLGEHPYTDEGVKNLDTCVACGWGGGPLCSPWNLEGCVSSACGECALSEDAVPCQIKKDKDHPIGGIIVGMSSGDVLVPAINAIDSLVASMSEFRDAIPEWSENMDAYLDKLMKSDFRKDYGGINPVTYRWNDSRGYNSVEVEVGNFTIPYIDDESRDRNWYSTDECAVLQGHTDELKECWVKVTRNQPTSTEDPSTITVPMGVLGNFNPFNRGVTKKSYADYNIDSEDDNTKNHVSLVKR